MNQLIDKLNKLRALSQEILDDAVKIKDSINEGDELLNIGLQSYFFAPFTYLENNHRIDNMIHNLELLNQEV